MCLFGCFAFGPSLVERPSYGSGGRLHTPAGLWPAALPQPGFISGNFRQRLGGKLSRDGSSPPLPRIAPTPLFFLFSVFPASQLSRGARPRGEPSGALPRRRGALPPRPRIPPLPRTMARGCGPRPAVEAGRRVLSGGQRFSLSPQSPRPASQQKGVFLSNHRA